MSVQTAAWWGVWTGPGPAPGDLIRLDDVACTGACHLGAHDCVEPGLAALFAVIGDRMCDHTSTPHRPCPPCSLALRELAELARDSIAWCVHDGSHIAAVTWALQEYTAAGIITPTLATALAEAFTDHHTLTPAEYLTAALHDHTPTWEQARAVAVTAHGQAQRTEDFFTTPGIEPRDAHHNPPRAAYQRAEAEIARRNGWPAPQRFMLEERVRACAVASFNEANWVRLCTEDGIALIPKTGAPHLGVVAYSAHLLDLPATDRRTYSGMHLAKDLALSALREIQWQEPAALHNNAWATWMALCSDVDALQGPPQSRDDGRWDWILPEVAATTTGPVPHLVENPTDAQVRAYLRSRQGGVCAMCQIRRRGWTATTGEPIPPALLAPALNLDHDHATGLVRGLLCTPCNSSAEPAGIRTREDVWSTYTTQPPIGAYHVSYPPRR